MDAADQNAAPTPVPAPAGRRWLRRAILAVILIALAAAGAWWWLDSAAYARTDDAYVQADLVPVGAAIDGQISAVLVAENEAIVAGQPVASLDPEDARIALSRGLAELTAERASTATQLSNVDRQQAVLAELSAAVQLAEADATRTAAALARVSELARQGWATRQALETAIADAKKSTAAVTQARAALRSGQSAVTATAALSAEAAARADVTGRSIAALDRRLSQTQIVAPVSGTVAALSARIGQSVQAGFPLLYIVPDSSRYVTAYFKETQISRLRPGQDVAIKVDAIRNQTFRGIVVGIAPATSSQFSLFPINTATGPFTRFVQRVPVRIKLADTKDFAQLRPGLSLKIAVDVR